LVVVAFCTAKDMGRPNLGADLAARELASAWPKNELRMGKLACQSTPLLGLEN